MKTDPQIIHEMLMEDISKLEQGKLNRANALVVASSQVKKGKASSKNGLLTVQTDAFAIGEISHGERIAILFMVNKKEYDQRRAVSDNFENS